MNHYSAPKIELWCVRHVTGVLTRSFQKRNKRLLSFVYGLAVASQCETHLVLPALMDDTGGDVLYIKRNSWRHESENLVCNTEAIDVASPFRILRGGV